ncbi:ABC transporter permease [Nocardioides yefusunii]|uniref:ABC transporter permease n=1 Tax=Nocardioides yefusunii TaxID=2500546 RepID=A0ABW1QXV1_9ACTN|nr:ABC transporter permease [Nocardioides yefusunii]
MSTATPTGSPAPAASTVDETPKVLDVVSRKAAVTFSIVMLVLATVLTFSSQEGDTTFRFASNDDFFSIPDLVVPAMTTAWVLLVIGIVLTAEAWRRYAARQDAPGWLISLFVVVALVLFLCWAAAGQTLPMVGLFSGTVLLAVPLVFGALGGVLGERVGVVNIAIDGQLLAGAFAGAVLGSLVGSAWAGVVGAALAGALVGLLLGIFAISYYVEQVIVGVVLNVLIIGFTSFMFGQVLSDNPELLNTPPRLSPVAIPVLSQIPVIGPVLFKQSPLVYLLYVAVAVVTFALYRTKWGLRVRAVGEHPKAADTVGIKVVATRYKTVILAGAIAGAGGAFYSMVAVQGFNREMTGGAGYIALAAVIFGKWHPIKATLAALLFGFASNLQGTLSAIGAPVPSEFMLMAPYVVTILAVAGFVGHSRGPAAAGVPYKKS